MPDRDLQDLVRRRLWELARTVEDAARRSHWALPQGAVERLGRLGGSSFVSEHFAGLLAQVLAVPENRVRRAAGLPEVPDEREDITTAPHLWLVRKNEHPE